MATTIVEMGFSNELPLYQCHKQVRAAKIMALETTIGPAGQHPLDSVIYFEDPRHAPIVVSAAFVAKHGIDAFGYYIVYEDGYVSVSPVAPFESGYTLIEPKTDVPPLMVFDETPETGEYFTQGVVTIPTVQPIELPATIPSGFTLSDTQSSFAAIEHEHGGES